MLGEGTNQLRFGTSRFEQSVSILSGDGDDDVHLDRTDAIGFVGIDLGDGDNALNCHEFEFQTDLQFWGRQRSR